MQVINSILYEPNQKIVTRNTCMLGHHLYITCFPSLSAAKMEAGSVLIIVFKYISLSLKQHFYKMLSVDVILINFKI